MIDLLSILLGFCLGSIVSYLAAAFFLGWSSQNLDVMKLALYESELEMREERLEKERARKT